MPAAMLKWILLCCGLALALAGCQTLGGYKEAMKEGQELYAQKKYDAAIERFNDALRQDPNQASAQVWIARAQIGKGDWNAAIASARKARAIAPETADAVPVLAEALRGAGSAAVKAGELSRSIPLFLEAIQLEPGNAAGYVAIARAYIGEKQWADAVASLSRALDLLSDPALRREALELLLEGARRLLMEGELTNAQRFLSAYTPADSAAAGAWLDLARAYLKTGNNEGAVSAFAGGLNGDTADSRELLGELFDAAKAALADGRWRDAAALLRVYVEHEQRNLQAFLDLARASWRAGDRFHAMDAYRQVLEINPRQEGALKYMIGQ